MCGGTISGTGTMGDRNFRSDDKLVAVKMILKTCNIAVLQQGEHDTENGTVV